MQVLRGRVEIRIGFSNYFLPGMDFSIRIRFPQVLWQMARLGLVRFSAVWGSRSRAKHAAVEAVIIIIRMTAARDRDGEVNELRVSVIDERRDVYKRDLW